MVSITIQLDDDLAGRLRALADAEQRSEDEIVAAALAMFTQSARPTVIGAGKYRSGHSTTSEAADQILRDAASQREWL